MARHRSRHRRVHFLQSRVQGSPHRHEEGCRRTREPQSPVYRTQMQERDGIGKCIVWELITPSLRIGVSWTSYFSSPVVAIPATRFCFSANNRLISVTSSSSFFGSCSTAACLQSSVQCSLSFISALMPPQFLQTLRTRFVLPYAEIAH
jgi:hypothetical protein